jgi:DeoR family fructose operon transcriptional repressor
LGVSSATIRRDLTELENDGQLTRTHGGAKLKQPNSSINSNNELSAKRKNDIHISEKIRIAKYAANLINDGDCIFLDSGTTPAYIYDFIRNKRVTIVTNNFMLVDKIKSTDKAIIVFGAGEYSPILKLVRGCLYLDIIKKFNFTHVFIGVSGFNIKLEQCSCTSLEASSYKKCAMSNSEKSYLVADSSKRKEKGIISFAVFDDFTSILTTAFPEKYKSSKIVIC